MQFMHTDLGPRQPGEVIEVTLSSAANVRLMDPVKVEFAQRSTTSLASTKRTR